MKVSVVVITYNQEAYIAQTLDSVIEQRCSFDFEIVVGEDYSTDGTRRICQEYQLRHPDKIRLLLHEKNQGLVENYYQTLALCRGEYIAQCAGDDYWCDPLKLQKQVSFLDAHPKFALTMGGARVYDVRSGTLTDVLPEPCDGWFFERYMLRKAGNAAAALTMCFRRSMFNQVNVWEIREQHFSVEELPLLLELSKLGKFHVMSDVLGVYRMLPGSVSRELDSKLRILRSYGDVYVFYAHKYGFGGAVYCHRIQLYHLDSILKLLVKAGRFEEVLREIDRSPRFSLWRWKIFRAWAVAKLPFLRRVLFKHLHGETV